MSTEGKTETEFIRQSSLFEKISTALIVLPFAVTGGAFLTIILLGTFPELNVVVPFFLWVLFPVFLTLLIVFRNRILEWLFEKISRRAYLEFDNFMKYYPLFVLIFGFVIGFNAFREPFFFIYAITFVFLSFPLTFIFDSPLTTGGKIQILFDGLINSLDSFSKRQYYWENISELIERLLKNGNIRILSGDLIHQFNKTLLETTKDISEDLRSIQAWMLGEQRTCLDSIKEIYPNVKLEPYSKESNLRRFLENLTPVQANLIKFIATLVVITIISVIVIVMRPELAETAFNLLKGALGIP